MSLISFTNTSIGFVVGAIAGSKMKANYKRNSKKIGEAGEVFIDEMLSLGADAISTSAQAAPLAVNYTKGVVAKSIELSVKDEKILQGLRDFGEASSEKRAELAKAFGGEHVETIVNILKEEDEAK